MQASDNTEDWGRLMDSDPVRAVRRFLGHYYTYFDDYDQISFPIFYEANVGEADLIEVIRISPEDATTLIDERKERINSPDGQGRQKLAGTALHHFGAFLDRVWRKNDIMWGRLDGAERLLAALLPGPQNEKVRTALIEEAHEAILFEEMSEENRLQLGGLMTEAIVRAGSGEPMEEAIGKVLANLDSSPIKSGLQSVIRTGLDNQKILEFVRRSYRVNRRLDPQMMLKALSRSTQIIGKVFEDIANKNQLDGKSLAWIARLGQMFWGLVEVAVPNSIANLLLKRWLQVIYVFEFFLIIGGIILSRPGAQQFGWTAFGITAILNIIILMLKDRMQNRRGIFYATGLVVGISFLFLAALGALDISGAVFNLKVGAGELDPREWLRQNIKAILPQGGWWVYLPGGLFIATALLLVVALNLTGAHNFRWLSMRLSLWKKWLMQSRLAPLVPGGSFKPIKLDSNQIQDGVRSFAGPVEKLYLLPFHLSAEPPVEWTRIFQQQFTKVAEDNGPGVRTTVYNDQCWLIAPAPKIRPLHSLLKVAIADANHAYEASTRKKAEESYKNQLRLVRSLKKLNSSDHEAISETLDDIAKEATKLTRRLRRGGRIIGLLTALTGLLVLLFISASYVRAINANVSLPAGLHMPGLALELVRTPAEVDQIVTAAGILSGTSRTPAPDSTSLATQSLVSNIKGDYWFIAWYAIVLGSLSIWLFRRAYSKKARNLVIAVGLLILIAAIFDVVENIRMLQVLIDGLRTQEAIAAIRFAGTMKWGSLFVSIGLLAWLFVPRKNITALIGYLLLSTALLGLTALVYIGAIEAAFFMMGLSMLVLGLVVLLAPHRLVWSDGFPEPGLVVKTPY